jgi:hypothetical protein
LSDLEDLDGAGNNVQKCHLTCAMFNPRYKLQSLDPPVFLENKDDQYVEVLNTCKICGKEVVNGIKCHKTGECVHLRCALQHRINILK